ncbi:S16 family serine protease [Mycoplasma elephantis]|uniref:S16 family serine protease n=1 Tax=Mycoplasma elephantis TaxID=114882 RepID=UPI0004875E50|nr:S16 family serine protease [Mycoplasma elephantis]
MSSDNNKNNQNVDSDNKKKIIKIDDLYEITKKLFKRNYHNIQRILEKYYSSVGAIKLHTTSPEEDSYYETINDRFTNMLKPYWNNAWKEIIKFNHFVELWGCYDDNGNDVFRELENSQIENLFEDAEVWCDDYNSSKPDISNKKNNPINIDCNYDDDTKNESSLKEKENINNENTVNKINKKELSDNEQKNDFYYEKNKYPKHILDNNYNLSKKQSSKMFSPGRSWGDEGRDEQIENIIRELPWKIVSLESNDLNKAKKIINDNVYGMQDVKNKIFNYINSSLYISKHKENNFVPITKDLLLDHSLFNYVNESKVIQTNKPILLYGEPGVGKTHIAKFFAEALNRKFGKISINGMNQAFSLKGNKKEWSLADCGDIIKTIKKLKVSNPVILLVEVDKAGSSDSYGNLQDALLDILDPEQNNSFVDEFLEEKYDLSRVQFILTANNISKLSKPLIDRCTKIEIKPYSLEEKIQIAKNFIIPDIIKSQYLTEKLFSFNKKLLKYIIENYCNSAGLRELKSYLITLCAHVQEKCNNEEITEYVFNKKIIKKILGEPNYLAASKIKNNKGYTPGIINGLYATTSGTGGVTEIEICKLKSNKNNTDFLGNFDQSTRDSFNIAHAYVWENIKQLNLGDFNFDDYCFKLSMPFSSLPRSGTSAGMAFAIGLISIIKNIPISNKIAMTGEITAKGNILPVGGLEHKIQGALEYGIQKMFVPSENKKDAEKIIGLWKNKIQLIFVNEFSQVYEEIFNSKVKIGIK